MVVATLVQHCLFSHNEDPEEEAGGGDNRYGFLFDFKNGKGKGIAWIPSLTKEMEVTIDDDTAEKFQKNDESLRVIVNVKSGKATPVEES